MWICILKYGFFILNSKRALNSLDFSLVSLTQNDNALPFLQVDFFAAATPCNPLGRFALIHSAQNDKGLFVILSFRKKAKYPLAKPHFAIKKSTQAMQILSYNKTKINLI